MDTLKVVGYCRVSTKSQHDDGHSIDNQRHKIEAYCELHNYELSEIIIDEASGSDINRKGIQRIRDLKNSKSIDGVVILKMDRLTRRARDFHILLDEVFGADGISLHSVSDQINTASSIGKALISLILTFSEFEISMISERTKEGLKAKKRKGEPMGQAPYGYEYNEDKRLVKHEDEQKIIAKIKRLKKTLTLKKIQARLINNGHAPRRGKTFALSFISDIANGTNRGKSRRVAKSKQAA
jgi:site-specific DNA recombinase